MARRVRDLMRRDFIRVSPDEPAEEALRLMSMARVRALPVVWDGRVRGLVVHRDLAAAALGLKGPPPAGACVRDYLLPVEPVSPEASLVEAARRMVGEALPCLVAAEDIDGEFPVVGLITEGDLLREFYVARRAAC